MADGQTPETPIARALKKRRKLQAEIQRAMQELEDIEKFISLHRRFSTDDESNKGESDLQPTILSRAGHGQTQTVFEQLVTDILRQTGRPMQSSEIVDAFRERGHPIGGNETRTAWNRLWQAKDRGVLVNLPRLGYWLANEPLPESAHTAKPPAKKRPRGQSLREERHGKPRGRKPYLNDSQKEKVLAMFAAGMKGSEIATELGVSRATIYAVKNKLNTQSEEEGN
jgi:DNA-binding CsgD family transcriptional regulator